MTPEQMVPILADKEGSPCRYIRSVDLTHDFNGERAWQGRMHIFGLNRPPEELCYAWVDPDTDSLVTILNRPPVESPETAVMVYIASKSRS